ncbi:16S rRNA (cytosine(967)-C(5))-methyltransferase RsmB [Thalassotalea sp. LPB0316]|uniref:16S rRNA (cytosine(967)-C(5))-methyltransferase RsmB n=1 Tax=Thalassotalea sp. LPB0316 TaxID=2769490 RepID=UPI0018687B4F|nr:16S rRNA (cytosine(967)-C(5))-methyltransferase RsmB [Thalassotalea sp. LPB0316]QOL26404.1 16S rRNA (cytosine(967)-C(5))-methyltransferase RsmB [Thalassotalea sp. LPB0316]
MSKNVRALAAKCVFNVVDKGRSLSEELPLAQAQAADKDSALLQEICYGVVRYLPELEYSVRDLVDKPLKGKQRVAHFLLLVGIYQLKYMRIPDHAALNETVSAAKPLKQFHLKGMINAVLRNFLRQNESSLENLPEPVKYNHPSWFINKLKAAYPEKWQTILQANQAKPPMWLRVNEQHHSVTDYSKLLTQEGIEHTVEQTLAPTILLKSAVDVSKLPGFEQGHVSVQDGAAQQAGWLLEAKAGDSVLDCCSAPGGKTCHVLELTPDCLMTAIDIEDKRLARVQENLTRLNLNAKLVSADATTSDWWNGERFDRILLDAPCSATGVIRRHPDIKWLRKADDIDALAKVQQEILQNIWQMLKPGGTLLYATCSVLPEENKAQIAHFLANTPEASLVPITDNPDDIGWQILPDEQAMDGFYYAKLIKNN